MILPKSVRQIQNVGKPLILTIMKNYKILLFLAILAISCNSKVENQLEATSKNAINPVVKALFSSGFPEPGKISYSAWGMASSKNIEVLYNGHAEFFQDHNRFGHGENVGRVNFGSIFINTDIKQYGANDYNFSLSDVNNTNNSANWGANTSFGVAGGGVYPAFQVSFYVPKVIYLSPIGQVCNKISSNYPIISKSNPAVSLNWNLDINNSQVAIIFYYDGIKSQSINPMLPTTSFSSFVTAPDNGLYVINASDISNLPVGGLVEIYVGRGNDENVNIQGKEVYITANTYSKRTYMIVP